MTSVRHEQIVSTWLEPEAFHSFTRALYGFIGRSMGSHGRSKASHGRSMGSHGLSKRSRGRSMVFSMACTATPLTIKWVCLPSNRYFPPQSYACPQRSGPSCGPRGELPMAERQWGLPQNACIDWVRSRWCISPYSKVHSLTCPLFPSPFHPPPRVPPAVNPPAVRA